MATLSQHKARPALRTLNHLQNLPVPKAVQGYEAVRKRFAKHGVELQRPELDALSFYSGNAVMARIQTVLGEDTELGSLDPLVEVYQTTVQEASLRLFYYLLLICTRESRHVGQNTTFFTALQSKYGCMDFTRKLQSLDSTQAVNRLLMSPPQATLGAYTNHLVELFNLGQFSSSFGGPAWGRIAKVLRDFVHGTLSPELMLDTGFTLAHNGGPIFNKQVLYHTYDAQELRKILDVQRAGMIPNLIYQGPCKFLSNAQRDYVEQAALLLKDGTLTTPVDWDKVKALGAIGHYDDMKPKWKAKAQSKPKPGLKPTWGNYKFEPDPQVVPCIMVKGKPVPKTQVRKKAA